MTDMRETVLRKQLVKIAEEQGYGNPEFKIAVVPLTGYNFTTELFHVTLSAPGRDSINLFAKVAVLGKQLRDAVFKRIFEIEPYAYTKLFTVFNQLEDRHRVPKEYRLATPKFYGHSDTYLEEVIVLEDLEVSGYTVYDRFKSIDWEYAAASIEQLARLHGLSLAYQKEYPEAFGETKEMLAIENMVVKDEKMTWTMVSRSLELIHEENRPRVQKLLDLKLEPATTFMNYSKGKRPVIVHSDFKQANLMHKYDENGKLKVVIVDYQTLRVSGASTDLLYFLFNCSDGEFRKQHSRQLIDHYYEHMTAVLRRLHLDPEQDYPRADFDEELKETLPYSLIHSIMMLPIFYVEHKEVRQIEKEESLETLATITSKPSVLCIQRLNELVDECISWRIL